MSTARKAAFKPKGRSRKKAPARKKPSELVTRSTMVRALRKQEDTNVVNNQIVLDASGIASNWQSVFPLTDLTVGTGNGTRTDWSVQIKSIVARMDFYIYDGWLTERPQYVNARVIIFQWKDRVTSTNLPTAGDVLNSTGTAMVYVASYNTRSLESHKMQVLADFTMEIDDDDPHVSVVPKIDYSYMKHEVNFASPSTADGTNKLYALVIIDQGGAAPLVGTPAQVRGYITVNYTM